MKPQIDHFNGRAAQSVASTDDGWEIQLEGNIVIRNYDEDIGIPPQSIVGKTLLMVILSEMDTRAQFGFAQSVGHPLEVEEISLHPYRYSLTVPGYDEEVYPQRPDDEVEAPPHPDERVAQAPTPQPVPEEEQSNPPTDPDEAVEAAEKAPKATKAKKRAK